jgi:hypothetical protein
MITGRVLAKVADLRNIPVADHSGNETVFVVVLDSGGDSHFLQVRYVYSSDRETLPERFFDYSVLYRFNVTRDPSCDGPVVDIRHVKSTTGVSGVITPAADAPEIAWNGDARLTCFVLKPGGWRVTEDGRAFSRDGDISPSTSKQLVFEAAPGPKQVIYKLDGVILSDPLRGFGRAIEKYGDQTPVVCLIDSRLPIYLAFEGAGIAEKAGFRDVPSFALDHSTGKVSEIKFGLWVSQPAPLVESPQQ